MAVPTADTLYGKSLDIDASNEIQTFAAAGTLVVTGSMVRVSLSGTTYTVTLDNNNVPSSVAFGGTSGAASNPIRELFVIVEANTASGTVTIGGANLLAGGISPTLATTVTGVLQFLWDSAISKWVFVRNA